MVPRALPGRSAGEEERIADDIIDDTDRVLRGGAFDYQSAATRSADRFWFGSSNRYIDTGFRLARTYR